MESADWTTLDDPQLLEKRIAELNLKFEGTDLEPLIRQLYDELAQKNLIFQPPCFVADEWFCPVGIPAIGVPFFLVHERLRKLERSMMLEVEGETKAWFMKLMRHEAGHAYSYAYRLYKKKKWQEHFGLASAELPDTYRPRPYSRSFVIHLEDWYAQSHPDEDFAETFAVWLTPDSNWRERYRGWKAMPKLEYVDQLMQSLAGKPPVHQPKYRAATFAGLNLKLKTYYQRKRKQFEETYPDFYDSDLRKLFVTGPAAAGHEKASAYLARNRRQILASVSQWTSEKKYTVNSLLKKLIERCEELDLHVKTDDLVSHLHVTAYITSLVMSYLFTGKFKRTK